MNESTGRCGCGDPNPVMWTRMRGWLCATCIRMSALVDAFLAEDAAS